MGQYPKIGLFLGLENGLKLEFGPNSGIKAQCDNLVSAGQTPQNELQIYTWMDATLKELTGLIKEVNPESRRRGTYFDFAIVYPDLRQGPR